MQRRQASWKPINGVEEEGEGHRFLGQVGLLKEDNRAAGQGPLTGRVRWQGRVC